MKNLAPYQIFFPLGLLNALLAVGVWFIQDLGWFSSPTQLIHAKLIVGGFLWSFIVGFLMTAIPKMTGTAKARPAELSLLFVMIVIQMFLSWELNAKWFYGANILMILSLLSFVASRIAKKTKPFPIFVSHIGIALILALVGATYHYRWNSFMGIHLYHVGTILLLVLGIGTRFFSFLSGLPATFENSIAPWKHFLFHSLGVLVAVFLFLSGKGFTLGYLGLTIVSLVYLFVVWQVQRPSAHPSPLKYGLRIVAAMIPLSFFMTWLQPSMYITWFHLLFIGCFGIITFSVATRVTLAHGAYPINFEIKSRMLWWVIALLSLGLISRILYGYSDGMWKKSFLHLAATFWFAAVICWCKSFLVKIFRSGEEAKPSC